MKGGRGKPGIQGRDGFKGKSLFRIHSKESISYVIDKQIHKYKLTGQGGIPGEPGREGPKGLRGVVIEIGEIIKPEKGDTGDLGYPGSYNCFYLMDDLVVEP